MINYISDKLKIYNTFTSLCWKKCNHFANTKFSPNNSGGCFFKHACNHLKSYFQSLSHTYSLFPFLFQLKNNFYGSWATTTLHRVTFYSRMGQDCCFPMQLQWINIDPFRLIITVSTSLKPVQRAVSVSFKELLSCWLQKTFSRQRLSILEGGRHVAM